MHRAEITRRTCLGLLALVACLVGASAAPPAEPARGPDIVRATVQLRNENRRGSGTVIASAPDEIWILTAAHVVRDATGLKVEIHRFNYGARFLSLTEGGGWPRLVPATVAAIDPGADVALVLIRGMTALPFVAKFDLEAGEPKRGEVLTSVGVDRGLHLTRWQTTIQGPALVDIRKGGGAPGRAPGVRKRGDPALVDIGKWGERLFTVTTRPPEHGRSGGGLFRADGTVIGSCTGRFDLKPGQKVGLFATMTSIRRLIRENGLERVARPPVAKR